MKKTYFAGTKADQNITHHHYKHIICLHQPASELHPLLMLFFFQAEDGIRDTSVTGVQTCALPIFFETLFVSKTSVPDSSFSRSIRSSMSRPSRSVFLCASLRISIASLGSSTRLPEERSSSAPRIDVRGFRSSCETVATNSLFLSSSSTSLRVLSSTSRVSS